MVDLVIPSWREKMNVVYAWSLAPKWCCLIAAMQCASDAIATGECNDVIPLMSLSI